MPAAHARVADVLQAMAAQWEGQVQEELSAVAKSSVETSKLKHICRLRRCVHVQVQDAQTNAFPQHGQSMPVPQQKAAPQAPQGAIFQAHALPAGAAANLSAISPELIRASDEMLKLRSEAADEKRVNARFCKQFIAD